ncbi:MAG: RIP metalloprotease RseP [Ignavibacteriaceae bacterium]|nr:RIP metalloprotease RseP [Ignavibacteriaceae bacterium]
MSYIIYFAITIGILVFVHEFGHFAAAKLCGMRADIFAIGFGKRLFGWNKITGFTFGELPKDFDGLGNTDYRFSLLPLGGYVKIAGMVDESFDTKFANEVPQPYEFRVRPVWQKVVVITAGVIMNLLLAWAIFWGANFFQGKEITKTTSIAYVQPNTAADSSGFKSGDKILSVNNVRVENWEDVRAQIFVHTLGENLHLKINRNSNIIDLNIPRKRIPETENAEMMYLIPEGVRPAVKEIVQHSPAERSKLKAGDILLQVKNESVFLTMQAIQIFSSNKEVELPLEVLRGKDTVNLLVSPGKDGKIGAMIGDIFTGPSEIKTYGFFTSIGMGYNDIVKMTNLTFNMIGKVFKGEIAFGKAFGGPIKIAQVATSSADRGIGSFLYFLALLSLSLAIINIMPFPVLDGGHLLIIIIEGIIKKEIPIKVKIGIQNAGFVILLLLMAFIIYNDILNL